MEDRLIFPPIITDKIRSILMIDNTYICNIIVMLAMPEVFFPNCPSIIGIELKIGN